MTCASRWYRTGDSVLWCHIARWYAISIICNFVFSWWYVAALQRYWLCSNLYILLEHINFLNKLASPIYKHMCNKKFIHIKPNMEKWLPYDLPTAVYYYWWNLLQLWYWQGIIAIFLPRIALSVWYWHRVCGLSIITVVNHQLAGLRQTGVSLSIIIPQLAITGCFITVTS